MPPPHRPPPRTHTAPNPSCPPEPHPHLLVAPATCSSLQLPGSSACHPCTRRPPPHCAPTPTQLIPPPHTHTAPTRPHPHPHPPSPPPPNPTCLSLQPPGSSAATSAATAATAPRSPRPAAAACSWPLNSSSSRGCREGGRAPNLSPRRRISRRRSPAFNLCVCGGCGGEGGGRGLGA